MAQKLNREIYKLFSETGSTGIFGSRAASGTNQGIISSSVSEIQSNDAFAAGWNSAVVSGYKLPPLEEMNGLQYVFSYAINYLYQAGIPEWNADETYYSASVCKHNGIVYYSLIDGNIGNAPSGTLTDSFWRGDKKGGEYFDVSANVVLGPYNQDVLVLVSLPKADGISGEIRVGNTNVASQMTVIAKAASAGKHSSGHFMCAKISAGKYYYIYNSNIYSQPISKAIIL